MDKDWIPIVFVLVVLAFLILTWIWTAYSTRKRAEALSLLAREMGFEFIPKSDKAMNEWLSSTKEPPVFRPGRARYARNIFKVHKPGGELQVFDYYYTTGAGKHRHVHSETIALFALSGQYLPDFQIAPKNWLDRVTEKWSRKNLEFPNRAEFSDKYRVFGENETEVRNTISDPVITRLENSSNISVESDQGRLVIYRYSKVVRAEELRAFVQEAEYLYESLKSRSF